MITLTFEDLVKENFARLSPGQKKVAEYILKNLERSSYNTLAQISRDTSVSETTVIRLSYALGFRSFSEMQKCIQTQILDTNNHSEGLNNTEQSDEYNLYTKIIEQDIEILKQTINGLDQTELDQIVQQITHADKVVVVGNRTAFAAANWFSMTLGILRDNVRLVPSNGDAYGELLSMTEKTVVLAISFPRYSKLTFKFTKLAKEKGATIISVTDSKVSPVGCISDNTLITNSNRDVTGYNSMSSVISLLNLIVVGVRIKDSARIASRLQQIEEYYSSSDILFE
ncbi:MurR/RpiR family transcriptional regulator [Paenibacillus naphthalenovorans]|uniref:MurR/RpiR family transcriptional regulator n=1 Tax=Paenibacillus naphthalenovorans TaxID=162209 RepID=UPI003D292A33